MSWKVASASGLILISISLLAAQEPTPQPGQRPRGGRGSTREFLGLGPAPDPVAAARGEKTYLANCAICHGAKATGATATNLVRSPLVLHDEKGEEIGPVILKGRPEAGMPAFSGFSAEQIADISQFLRLRVEQIANRGIYQRANVITGDAKKGEAYFNGAGRCNTCHSVSGDLAHVGAKYSQPDQLQNRFLYPGSPAARKKVTVTLPNGKSISGTIKQVDDFNVSLLDENGDYQSFIRGEGVKVEIADPLAAHKELAAKYSDADMHNLSAYLVTLK